MNRALLGLVTLLITTITSPANAVTLLWTTGCISPGRPDALTVTYQTETKKITLYRAWTNQFHNVEDFTADHLGSFDQPTIFRSSRVSGVVEVQAFFGTKATMYLAEETGRIQYTCAYFSFDRATER